jgi:filamentous hemagglutinin family protein
MFNNTITLSAIATTLGLALLPSMARGEPSIAPATDSIGTTVEQQGDRYDIGGGTRAGNNLFHSFERLGLSSQEIANFLATPDLNAIVGRVTGGNPSVIEGLIRVSGGNPNLYLMNPAGIVFGAGARLDVPASFTATTATSLGFSDGGWFPATGTVDFSGLGGSLTWLDFASTQPGHLLNAGSLSVSEGQSLWLLTGGNAISTGSLTAPKGNIMVAAIPGTNRVRIAPNGSILSLEVIPPDPRAITGRSLPELLAGGQFDSASQLVVNVDGSVSLRSPGGELSRLPARGAVVVGTINTSSQGLPESHQPSLSVETGIRHENRNRDHGNRGNGGQNGNDNNNGQDDRFANGSNQTANNGNQGNGGQNGNNQTANNGNQGNGGQNGSNQTANNNVSQGNSGQNGNNQTANNGNQGNGGQNGSNQTANNNVSQGNGGQNGNNQTANNPSSPTPNSSPGNSNNVANNPNTTVISNPGTINSTPSSSNSPAVSSGPGTTPGVNAQDSSTIAPTSSNTSDRPISAIGSNNGQVSVVGEVRSNTLSGTFAQQQVQFIVPSPRPAVSIESLPATIPSALLPPNTSTTRTSPSAGPSAGPSDNSSSYGDVNAAPNSLVTSGAYADRPAAPASIAPNAAPSRDPNATSSLHPDPALSTLNLSLGLLDHLIDHGRVLQQQSIAQRSSLDELSVVLSNLQTIEHRSRREIAINLDGDRPDLALLEIDRLYTTLTNAHLGRVIGNPTLTLPELQTKLTQLQHQVGLKPAILYTFSRPEQLDLVLVVPDAPPIHRTVTDATRQRLLTEVNNLRIAITQPIARNTENYRAPAEQLYRWIVGPVAADLARHDINTIAFAMDRGMRSLPVAALHNGQEFLIERYSLGLIPSASLTDTQFTPIQAAPVLSFGVSEFSDMPPLPAVPIELSVINHLAAHNKSFLNEDFNLENLKRQRRANPFPVLHFATHADFRPGTPQNSFVRLWDRRLVMTEWRQLGLSDPPVELLVLSACRTAIGDDAAELGFAGLAVETGVESVLASLWYVSDEGTLGLMASFYDALRSAPIKAEALRQAQLAMLRGQTRAERGRLIFPGGNIPLPSQVGESANFALDLLHESNWMYCLVVEQPS